MSVGNYHYTNYNQSKLRMMTENVQSLTDKVRHSTCRSFRGRHPDPLGESPTADLLLRGGLAQFALRRGSICTLGRIRARGHILSAVWKLLLTEGFHWLRCFWWARVAGVHDLGHSGYMTPVTMQLASSAPKPWLLVLTLSFQWLRSFSLYWGRCTCHTTIGHTYSHQQHLSLCACVTYT